MYIRPAPKIADTPEAVLSQQHSPPRALYPRPVGSTEHMSDTRASPDRLYTGDMPGGFFVTVEKHVEEKQTTSTPHITKTNGKCVYFIIMLWEKSFAGFYSFLMCWICNIGGPQ